MIRSYEELIRTADAYADSWTLITGVELGVFTHIGPKSVTAKAVARKSRTSPEGMEFLLNALVGMGVLVKRGNRYQNTPLSRTYLDAASPKSITNFLWLAGQHWEDWMGLTQAIRKGRGPRNLKAQDDLVFRRRFAKALHERSFYLTPRLIRHIHLGRAKSLLDLGGGAGTHAMAFCQAYPGLTATIFDLPETLHTTERLVKEARLEGRIRLLDRKSVV